jgi:hypothetical protein
MWSRATTISASRSWRYSSSVRACTMSAREAVPGPVVLSIMRMLAPSFVSHRARARPVGPAPTIRTSWRMVGNLERTSCKGPLGRQICDSRTGEIAIRGSVASSRRAAREGFSEPDPRTPNGISFCVQMERFSRRWLTVCGNGMFGVLLSQSRVTLTWAISA